MEGDGVDNFVEGFHEPEVLAGCPVHIGVAILRPDKWGKKRVVSGRGLSRKEAASRCRFEAIERHSAIFDEDRVMIWASQASLGTVAITPQSLILISDDQYLQRGNWNSRVAAHHRLPSRFDKNQNLAWVPARSLITGDTKLVPAAYCFLGYPRAIEEGFPVPDSNGLASGDQFEDATDRALLEVVERDAISIWWYGCVRRPAMNLDIEKIPLWKPFAAWTHGLNREFWILDLTHDLGIPVAAAISCDSKKGNLAFGYAAARTKEAAAQSAIGELVQFEVTKTLQSNPQAGSGFLAWCMSAKLGDHHFILPHETARPPREPPSIVGGGVGLELFKEKGLDVLVVEFQNRNANVVRVLVPGLRPVWPRFAPGRLYDVPYEMGWHASQLNETELNSIHILY